MLIEELELGGFLSYRKRQKIRLYDVTSCLITGMISGDADLSNGTGKSALLEMIPFNFFGKEAGRSDRPPGPRSASTFADFTMQPASGISPVPFSSCDWNPQYFGALLKTQTGEVAKLDKIGLRLVHLRKPAEGIVDGFDRQLIPDITREPKVRNYDGSSLDKMPDMLISAPKQSR